jgi:hypothetical protein
MNIKYSKNFSLMNKSSDMMTLYGEMANFKNVGNGPKVQIVVESHLLACKGPDLGKNLNFLRLGYIE